VKPLRLEFTPRAHSPLALVTMMLAGIACGFLAVQAWLQHQALARIESEIAQAEARVVARPIARAASATPAQREAQQRIAAQLNTPWSDLLDALEAATPQDVAIVSIEPDMRRGTVHVQAEARTLDTLLAYAEALQDVPLFDGVELARHETFEQDPNRPLRLALQLRMRKTAQQEKAP
jgi:Tfp pilus assembly protein PilN